ncbi:MAG: hypothetical protein K8U57_25355 [Planctomycetes bacterium]|nr:hypothetical protein [Planctomycetota bacterium]
MTETSRLLCTALLLAICSFAPGFFFVRRLRWNYLETACGSVALSYLLVYLASTLVFLLNLGPTGYYCSTAVAIGLGLACRKDLRRYFARRDVQRLFAGFGVLVVWGLVLLALVRTYAGGFWAGDYWEHYERALYFLHRYPTDYQFLGLYGLTARPPFMNLVMAFYLGQVGDSFPAYQVISQFLNLLVYFPLIFMAGLMVRGGHRRIGLIVAFLALCPSFQQNHLFLWTKLFCGFFTLLGLALYLRGWRKHDSGRMLAAVVSLACAALVHYSAGPYLLFLAIHYLVLAAWGLRPKWEVPVAGVLAATVLATWFGWAFALYGPTDTLGANPTVTASAQLTPIENVQKVASNTLRTLVPHPVYLPRATFEEFFWQPNRLGYWREYWFLIYQTALFPMMGLAGGLIVTYLLTRDLQDRQRIPRSLRVFWVSFIPFCTLVGIAVNGGQELVGMAHVCLQPLALLGVVYLAASLGTLPVWLRRVALLGVAFDAAVGIVLHVHMLRYSLDRLPDGRIGLSDQLPAIPVIENAMAKAEYPAVFVGDLVAPWTVGLMVLVVTSVIGFLAVVSMEAETGGLRRAPFSRWWVFGIGAVLVAMVAVACLTQGTSNDFGVGVSPRIVRSSAAGPHLEAALREYAAGNIAAARSEIVQAHAISPTDPEVDYYFRLWSRLHGW